MGAKEKNSIQESSAKLKEKIALYHELMETNQTAKAGDLVKGIREENTALDENISLSKRGSTAVRGWTDSIGNAIKQTASYALSLGLLRQAYSLVNDAIKIYYRFK